MGLTMFPNGITSMGSPITSGSYITTGSVFYVDSNTGSDDNTGTEPTKAVATMRKAVTLCTSGRCDTVFLMPNHAETISSTSGANIIYSGVRIIGLGRGENRPTFTFDTTVGACIAVSCSAHSVWIENILLKSGLDALSHIIVSAGSELHIVNCEYEQVGAFEPAEIIEITSDARRVTIDGFIIKADTDAAGADLNNAIKIVGPNQCEIKNCYINIKATSGIISCSSAGSTEIKPSWVHHNYFEQPTTSAIINWSSGDVTDFCVISDNFMKTNVDNAEVVVGGASNVWAFNNQVVTVDGEASNDLVLSPGATSA